MSRKGAISGTKGAVTGRKGVFFVAKGRHNGRKGRCYRRKGRAITGLKGAGLKGICTDLKANYFWLHF